MRGVHAVCGDELAGDSAVDLADRARLWAGGRSPTGRGRALKPPSVRVRVPPSPPAISGEGKARTRERGQNRRAARGRGGPPGTGAGDDGDRAGLCHGSTREPPDTGPGAPRSPRTRAAAEPGPADLGQRGGEGETGKPHGDGTGRRTEPRPAIRASYRDRPNLTRASACEGRGAPTGSGTCCVSASSERRSRGALCARDGVGATRR